jgi:hypothetical protein
MGGRPQVADSAQGGQGSDVQQNSGGTLKIHNSIIGAAGGLLISVESGRLDRYGKLDSGSAL